MLVIKQLNKGGMVYENAKYSETVSLLKQSSDTLVQ